MWQTDGRTTRCARGGNKGGGTETANKMNGELRFDVLVKTSRKRIEIFDLCARVIATSRVKYDYVR